MRARTRPGPLEPLAFAELPPRIMHSVLHLEELQQSAGFCYVVPPPMRREVEAPFYDWQLANFPIEVLNSRARHVHRANPPPVDVEPLAPRQLLVSSARINRLRQPGESRVEGSVSP